jgi:hypothetical protein
MALAVALAVGLAATATPAMAAPPDHSDVTFEFDVVVEGYCAFPIDVHVQQTAHQTVAFHENGVPAKILAHVVEQDTFSANGKVLQTLPYVLNYQLRFDPEGNLTYYVSNGVVLKAILPDGSLFVSAGRVNWINHLDATFIVEPDWGSPVDQSRFCAALAP